MSTEVMTQKIAEYFKNNITELREQLIRYLSETNWDERKQTNDRYEKDHPI